MTVTRHPLWGAYRRFHTLAVRTGDVDPAYPVLRHYADARGWDEEDRLWLTFAHVAYYNLNTAGTVTEVHRTPGELAADTPALKLPTGTERRGFRDPAKLARHLVDLQERVSRHGSLRRWVESFTLAGDTPEERWAATEAALLDVYGNGRWATYKTAEVLAKVNGYSLHAPDMAHQHSSGPRKGLALLGTSAPGNGPDDVARLDRASTRIVKALAAAGAPGAETETVETTLCDFHSMSKGRYYVGHDIDEQLHQLTARRTPQREVWLGARAASFHPGLLGEANGWTGPNKTLNTAYARTGAVNIRGAE